MSQVGRRRDTDRAAVSEAEIAAFDGTDLERVRPFDELCAVADHVVAGEWWRSCADVVADRSSRRIGSVSVVSSRADARSSMAVEAPGSAPQIRLAPPQATLATLAHELAHVLAGVSEQHGPVFRRALLDTVEAVTNTTYVNRRGRLHVEQLADAFWAAGLSLSGPRWPAPSVGGPIAL
ncbi:MAG: hypothetical protein AAGD33_23695 [Actinomycetota bacterium]